MTTKQLQELKCRIAVLERLIITFSYCRKLVRKYIAQILGKERKLRQNTFFKVAANGQLCLF